MKKAHSTIEHATHAHAAHAPTHDARTHTLNIRTAGAVPKESLRHNDELLKSGSVFGAIFFFL